MADKKILSLTPILNSELVVTDALPLGQTDVNEAISLSIEEIDKRYSAFSVGERLDTIIEATGEPTGFSGNENMTVSYDSTARTFTLTGTGWKGYYKGEEVTELVNGWVSLAHEDSLEHSYFLYYDEGGFQYSVDSMAGFDKLLIAVARYRTAWKYGMKENHGLMNPDSHRDFHFNIGTYKQSGGDISGVTLLSTTAIDRRPDVSSCIVWDEDLKTTNDALVSKTYTQRYLTLTNTITHAIGASEIVPVLASQPYYNLYTGGNWTQALLPSNSYMTVWLMEIPVTSDVGSQSYRHCFVQGQSISTATAANQAALDVAYASQRSKTFSDVNLGEISAVEAEYIAIHRFIIEYTGGNWSIRGSDILTGSKTSQSASPSGNFLSSVSTDDSIDGAGTAADQLSITPTNAGYVINSADAKATPIDADFVGLVDSADSNILKKLTWANIKATLKAYFDPLYVLTSTILGSVISGCDPKALDDADVVLSTEILGGTPTLSTWLQVKAFLKTYFDTLYTNVETVIDKGTVGGAQSVDWDAGTICKITMSSNVTFTDSNASTGQTMVYQLIQGTGGSKTVTWPTTKWAGGTAPTLTITAGKTDFVVRYFDGTSYFGFVGGLNL